MDAKQEPLSPLARWILRAQREIVKRQGRGPALPASVTILALIASVALAGCKDTGLTDPTAPVEGPPITEAPPTGGPATGPAMGGTEQYRPGQPADRMLQITRRLPLMETPRTVTVEVKDGLLILEGDIVLGTADGGDRAGNPAIDPSVIRNGQRYRWPGGAIPFQIAQNHPRAAEINAAITHFNTNTQFRLVRRTTQADFVSFVTSADAGTCSSWIGRQGGAQPITIGANCVTGSIIHEIGHAAGLYHEQSRTDRNRFVIINSANIQLGRERNFDQCTDCTDIGAYDFGSIMHYGPTAFSRNGLPTITSRVPGVTFGQRNGLSAGDIAGLRVLFCQSSGGVTVRRSDGFRFLPNEAWTQGCYYGSRGTFFADVTGDRRADAIVVNDNGITVRRSSGSAFLPNESWTTGAYYGSRGTFFADVTGDSLADAIVVNSTGVTVRRSDGTKFLPNESWTQGAYYGTRGTFFADATADGKADAIVVNDGGVTVRRSNGSGFLPNEAWTPGPYYGRYGTFFADATGDKRADAIVVNDATITLRPSIPHIPGTPGYGTSANQDWTHGPYHGSRGTFFADVTGDRLADAIAVKDGTVTVRRSVGFQFGVPLFSEEDWTRGPYYGNLGQSVYFADVTGDGKADAVVVNR